MAVREIVQLGDPRLWKACPSVTATAAESVQRTIVDLSDTLAAFRAEHGFGRGIAAPQIGDLARIIYIHMPDSGISGALVNPEIDWASDEEIEIWDDCFSFPDLMVRLYRRREIAIQYLDSAGEARQLRTDGSLSELLQHEIDHLDGILAVDRARSARDLATRSQWLSRTKGAAEE